MSLFSAVYISASADPLHHISRCLIGAPPSSAEPASPRFIVLKRKMKRATQHSHKLTLHGDLDELEDLEDEENGIGGGGGGGGFGHGDENDDEEIEEEDEDEEGGDSFNEDRVMHSAGSSSHSLHSNGSSHSLHSNGSSSNLVARSRLNAFVSSHKKMRRSASAPSVARDGGVLICPSSSS